MTAANDDPFRFLEDGTSAATIAWTAEQNARTRRVLDALPARAALERRFEELLAIGSLGVPVACGDRVFFTARRGNAEQASLYVREAGEERVLLDPEALDATGLTTIDWWFPSARGRYVAYGLSSGGDERSTLHVLDVASGSALGEAIPDTRYASVAWRADERAFYYTRHPPGDDYHVRAYRHDLGTPWQDDPEIFGAGRRPEESIGLTISADGRHLVVSAALGWARNDVYVADLSRDSLQFETLVEGIEAIFDAVPGNERLYVRTDDGAPNFRVFEVRYGALARERWIEIVPESPAVLDAMALSRDALALHYLQDVRSVVRLRWNDGTLGPADMTYGGTLSGWSANENDHRIFALSSSYFEAPVVRTVDAARGTATTRTAMSVASPVENRCYRVEQHWFVSKDGTRVPMDVLSRFDRRFDGTAPAVLYGYGGFNVSLVPSFAPHLTPWLDAGGIYAIANLRGGGEFGETWHRAGMRERKPHVFEDFVAAAEFLGTAGFADPRRIAVVGGSNGGLLVAAVTVRRPDLPKAVVCAVPLTDMLRYHRFLLARLWIAEYGDPDDPADAAFLAAYSPYHAVRDGVAYPAMLIETADGDTRVDPMHARKFAARVQAATAGNAPVLLSVESEAGHGVGKPRGKVVSELADRWAFIAWQLGATFSG